MKSLVMALVIFAGFGCAQQQGGADRILPKDKDKDNGAEKSKPTGAVLRRLEVVSWDPVKEQLTWVVSVWDLNSSMDKPYDLERYVIHADAGTIESKGELRQFDAAGKDLHAVMDVISTYAMRSTIWWGHRDDPEEKPDAAPNASPNASPGGSNEQKDKPKSDGKDDKPKTPPTGKAVVWLKPAK
jgi:hypothetical protein